jgi:hypothetical protein
MATTLHDELEYYATPGSTTELTRHTGSLAELPSDPDALGKIVRGVVLHNWMAAMRGVERTPERDGMQDIGATTMVERILELDAGPLRAKRPADRRMIGFCYHFALLQCALLRALGIPSRTRCGFAGYLGVGKWMDHWVVEYWDGRGWHLHDPQLGRDDLTSADFRNGVEAWRLCRSGDADPAIHGNGELWGWDELRGSLVNDVGALNKVEVGGWYWCELLKVEPSDRPHPSVDAELDPFADLAAGDDGLRDLREAYRRAPFIQPPEELVER